MEQNERARDEQLGSLAGLGAGVLAGAEIGTVVLPVPGVGTFVGAMVGGFVGSAIGRSVGVAALSGVKAFVESLSASKHEPEPKDRDGGTPA